MQRVRLTGIPEFVLMPAPVTTTTFLALYNEFAMSWSSRSDPGVTWTVGIVAASLSCGLVVKMGMEEVQAPPWNRGASASTCRHQSIATSRMYGFLQIYCAPPFSDVQSSCSFVNIVGFASAGSAGAATALSFQGLSNWTRQS